MVTIVVIVVVQLLLALLAAVTVTVAGLDPEVLAEVPVAVPLCL